MNASPEQLTQLCLSCGLCCDGTLFKGGELQSTDDPDRLSALGIAVDQRRFPQPCSALCADKSCRIYAERPMRCRQFECALYLEVRSGQSGLPDALETVAQTRSLADRIRRLLHELGDTDETRPLSLRFQRIQLAQQQDTVGDEASETFAELSLAVNDLTRTLKGRFYP